MPIDDHPIVMGKIIGAHGVKGWCRVLSFTRPKENILEYGDWLVRQNNAWLAKGLLKGEVHGRGLIASLEGVVDRDESMALIGSDVAIDKDRLPRPQEGEFYWHDLVGLQVINGQDEVLGVVKALLETGANDVLLVESGQRQYLIPYVRDIYIKIVDVVAGVIRVDWQSDF